MIFRPEPIRQIASPFQIAVENLGLEHLWIIDPGNQRYASESKITAIPLEEILKLAQTGLAT